MIFILGVFFLSPMVATPGEFLNLGRKATYQTNILLLTCIICIIDNIIDLQVMKSDPFVACSAPFGIKYELSLAHLDLARWLRSRPSVLPDIVRSCHLDYFFGLSISISIFCSLEEYSLLERA